MKLSAIVEPNGRVTRWSALVHDAIDVVDEYGPAECVPVTLSAPSDPHRVTDSEAWMLRVDEYESAVPIGGEWRVPRALPDWWTPAIAQAATAELRRIVDGMITTDGDIFGGEWIVAGDAWEVVGAYVIAVAPGGMIRHLHYGSVVDAVLDGAVIGQAAVGSLVRRIEAGGTVRQLLGGTVECVAEGGRVRSARHDAVIRVVEHGGYVSDVSAATIVHLRGQVDELRTGGVVHAVEDGGVVHDVRWGAAVLSVEDGGTVLDVEDGGHVLNVAPEGRVANRATAHAA